jgi:ATP-dependent Lon protease
MLLKQPFIPLKNIVVFPGVVLPLFIGRDKSVKALTQAVQDNSPLVVSIQHQNTLEDPTPDDIFTTGVEVRILKQETVDKDVKKVLIEGTHVVHIKKVWDEKGWFEVETNRISEDEGFKSKKERTESIQLLKQKLEEYLTLNKQLPSPLFDKLFELDNLYKTINTISHFLMFSTDQKMELLSLITVKDKLVRLTSLLDQEIESIKLEDKLHLTIKENIEKKQKKVYLKEKIEILKEELGAIDPLSYDEGAEYLEKISQGNFPQEVVDKVGYEVRRLNKFYGVSSESGIIKTYLDWLLDFPWYQSKEHEYSAKSAREILNKNHYGLDKVKQRIEEFLVVYKHTKLKQGPILCLVGPSGVGKTSIAKAIATVLGRSFVRLALGGVDDESELRGHRRTYVGSMSGRIAGALNMAESMNPVILLDEIDKIGKSYQGDPMAVLLEVLDSEQNSQFYDNYVEVPIDLKDVLFLATANSIAEIPKPLLDRMEIIHIPGYSIEEKTIIAEDFILPKVLKNHGLGQDQLRMDRPLIRWIVESFTKEAGCRELERVLSSIARKCAVQFFEDKKMTIVLDQSSIQAYLGPKTYLKQDVPSRPMVGVALGLAYTPNGSEILPCEALILPGSGDVKLTGKMGEVMRESVQTAYSFIRSLWQHLGLKKDFYKYVDIHVHIPRNAIAKEGPSAGLTITIAIISALLKNPIRNDVAMTGEVTLNGNVLPIGGLYQKLQAASGYGLAQVFIPKLNREEGLVLKKDYPHMTITPIENITQILDLVLLKKWKFKKSKESRVSWL